MIKTPARLFTIFLLFTIYYLLFTIKPVSAEIIDPQTPQQTNYNTPNTNPDVPKNLHTWTQNVMLEVMSAMTCQLAGIDPVNPNQKCLGADPKTGKIGFVEGGGGAIGVMGNLIAATYTPALHTGDYFKYLAQNFGIVKPSYAQGFGFQRLNPLIGLWTAFRNIVYLLFVIVFVVIGLAIMLRIKIDPRTVMSIENQIPKIIIGLLLVTFSFAIAGLLIDLMYVFIYLIFNIFNTPDLVRDHAGLVKFQQSFNGQNPLGLLNEFVKNPDDRTIDLLKGGFLKIAGDSSGSVKDLLSGLIGATRPPDKETVFPIISGIGDLFTGDWARNILAAFLGWLGAAIAFLIILVALLWAMFRLWFQLIMAYVFILLDIVFAPFWIMGGLFPGSPVSFGGWLRDILSNLIAFPATIVMFLLGKVFIETFNASSNVIFVPPLIGNPNGGQNSPFGSLIALGIILMTPQVVTMMKDAFKPPPFKYVSAIGQAIGVGPGIVGGAAHNLISPYGGLANIRRFAEGAAAFSKAKDGGIMSRVGAFSKAVSGQVAPLPDQASQTKGS